MAYSNKKDNRIASLNKKIIIIDCFIAVCALALIFAFLGFLKQKLKATASTVTYTKVRQSVVKGEHESIDFNIIRSEGSTATSWLYIPGTNIDYPLVQGPNNDYYIDTDAYGNPSEAGAIFINFANASDMSDAKTVIFGHNMSDGSMFTDLHNYAQEDYGKVHQDAYIYMESGAVKHYKLRYYVFTQPLEEAIYVVSKADTPEEEAEKIKNIAGIVYAEHTGNNLICLSTCSMHKYRTVVVFEYVDGAKPISGSKKYEESTSKSEETTEGPSAEDNSAASDSSEVSDVAPITEDNGQQ